VAVLFNVQNFKDKWKDNTFHKQPKMIVKNGKRRFHHCRILLQFGEIYSSEIHGKNQWNLLSKIISSFIILTKIGQLFIGIDSSEFKAALASQYYTERARLTTRRKYIKPSLTAADILQQIICTIKIRRAPTRHDIIFSTNYNRHPKSQHCW
jgi:hypothetical protein